MTIANIQMKNATIHMVTLYHWTKSKTTGTVYHQKKSQHAEKLKYDERLLSEIIQGAGLSRNN